MKCCKKVSPVLVLGKECKRDAESLYTIKFATGEIFNFPLCDQCKKSFIVDTSIMKQKDRPVILEDIWLCGDQMYLPTEEDGRYTWVC